MVLPYLFPLIVMVQGSLAGQGWGNYRAVLADRGCPAVLPQQRHHRGRRDHPRLRLTMLAAFGFSKLHVRGKEIYSG